MARWAIANRVEASEELKKFNETGYAFVPEQSTETEWVFEREQPPPAR